MKRTIIIGVLASLMMLFVGCDDKLVVQQAYEFLVSTMPIQKKIKLLETVEIRFHLNRTERYMYAKYYLSFFQSEGWGVIQNEKGVFVAPNEVSEVNQEDFSLYYTSYCQNHQTIDFKIRDNFKQECTVNISFEDNINDPSPL